MVWNVAHIKHKLTLSCFESTWSSWGVGCEDRIFSFDDGGYGESTIALGVTLATGVFSDQNDDTNIAIKTIWKFIHSFIYYSLFSDLP